MVARQQELYYPYAYGSLQRRHMSVSNRWWHDWLLSSLCQITPKKRSKLHISGPWWAEAGGFPHKGPLMQPWSAFASQPHYQELSTILLDGKHGSIQWSINLNWTYLWMHLFAKQSIEKREICIDRQIAACRYWGLSVWLMLWNANQDL